MQAPNFNDIRVIGFDLDQTLYPKSPLIDQKIQQYLYEQIAEHRGVGLAEAQRLFAERYKEGAGLSGRQTLQDLGIPGAESMVQEALERADIASILKPDSDTNTFLSKLSSKYQGVDLVTGSNASQTEKKLSALEIDPEVFSHILTADDASKSDGSAFTLWLSLYPSLTPAEFLYIGDRSRTDHDIPSALGIKTALVYVKEISLDTSVLQFKKFSDLFECI